MPGAYFSNISVMVCLSSSNVNNQSTCHRRQIRTNNRNNMKITGSRGKGLRMTENLSTTVTTMCEQSRLKLLLLMMMMMMMMMMMRWPTLKCHLASSSIINQYHLISIASSALILSTATILHFHSSFIHDLI